MERKHHDQCVEVFFVERKVDLGEALVSHLFSDEYDCVGGEGARDHEDDVEHEVPIDHYEVSESGKEENHEDASLAHYCQLVYAVVKY